MSLSLSGLAVLSLTGLLPVLPLTGLLLCLGPLFRRLPDRLLRLTLPGLLLRLSLPGLLCLCPDKNGGQRKECGRNESGTGAEVHADDPYPAEGTAVVLRLLETKASMSLHNIYLRI